MKEVAKLVKGDKIKFEMGNFDMFITMEVDKVEGSKVYGTVLSTMLNITKVGKYDSIDFGTTKWVDTI